jgi:hypothetical protein
MDGAFMSPPTFSLAAGRPRLPPRPDPFFCCKGGRRQRQPRSAPLPSPDHTRPVRPRNPSNTHSPDPP